ncbi:MAG: hypothetical protein WAL70_08430, partial [Aeromicrobium sp.]
MVPSRLPELARCAWLGEHLVRELHDVVQVDVVELPLVPGVAVQLLGEDRLRQGPKHQAVVGGDGMNGAALPGVTGTIAPSTGAPVSTVTDGVGQFLS